MLYLFCCRYNDGLRSKAAKDYGGAIRAFSRIITLKPESVLPYVQRAECYLMTADFKSAIQNYKKACTLDTQTDIYYNRYDYYSLPYYTQTYKLLKSCTHFIFFSRELEVLFKLLTLPSISTWIKMK